MRDLVADVSHGSGREPECCTAIVVSEAVIVEPELEKALRLEQLGTESVQLAAFRELIQHPPVALHAEHELGLGVQQTSELRGPRSRTTHDEAVFRRRGDGRRCGGASVRRRRSAPTGRERHPASYANRRITSLFRSAT